MPVATLTKKPTKAVLVLCLFIIALAACAPRLQESGPMTGEGRIDGDRFIARDGAVLPLRRWQPEGAKPSAVIVALHGFNDYTNAFDDAARYWAENGVLTYAIDQRGFGNAPHTGLWAGVDAMTADLGALIRAAHKRHQATPLYLVGDSMGGAVVMTTLTRDHALADRKMIQGAVLVAPAVWGRKHLGFFKRGLLWLSAHTLPWLRLSGRGLGITPSDNVEMLKKLSADPLVIKKTRIDTIWGLVNLMDAGFDAAGNMPPLPILLLYGKRDEIIPAAPTRKAARMLLRSPRARIAVYDGGYHMLLRDLQGDVVHRDVLHWMGNRAGALPSGAETRARRWLDPE